MLSVMIATSVGRQQDLYLCLKALQAQTVQNFEVIISDDGSEGMQAVLAEFQNTFVRLEYLWRPNDRNLSRTRNRGAEAALGEQLLFVNTDVLLNPQAIAAYTQALHGQPHATLWGYVGCRKRVKAPSQWCSRQVNWLDFRFFPLSAESLWVHPGFARAPHRFASGHHFALTRQTWESIGPMNEDFVNWGEEDVEFALRGLLKGHSMFLLGDAWAEHLDHPYQEQFHADAQGQLAYKQSFLQALEQQALTQGLQAGTRADILFSADSRRLLSHLIQTHYLPYAPQALELEMKS